MYVEFSGKTNSLKLHVFVVRNKHNNINNAFFLTDIKILKTVEFDRIMRFL